MDQEIQPPGCRIGKTLEHRQSMQSVLQPFFEIPATRDTRRPRRLLLVAYNFPPVGGAGVQRPVKWVKNLRLFGWDVTVLTAENPSVPTRDDSLLSDIPDDVL